MTIRDRRPRLTFVLVRMYSFIGCFVLVQGYIASKTLPRLEEAWDGRRAAANIRSYLHKSLTVLRIDT